MKTVLTNTIYCGVLIISAWAIWYYVWLAHTLEYDENFGAIIFAMIFSMVLTLSVALMWFWKKALIIQNKIMSLLFLITASPITILGFIYVYERVSGTFFKAG